MIQGANWIPLFIVIPLTGSFLISIVGKRVKGFPALVGVLAAAGLFIASLKAVGLVHLHKVVVYAVGAWKPPVGIAMVLDGLAAFMLVTINLVALAISVYAIKYMDRYTAKWKFYTLFLLMLGGMNGVIVTGDIFNLYVFLEIASLASFALVAFGIERHELEAAFKYAVMSTVGSLFILFAIVLLYGFTSTLNMADMAAVIGRKGRLDVMLMVAALFMMGFGLKSALVPFHAWLPDAHPSAPAPISAMLSGVLIKSLGVYTLARLLFNVTGLAQTVAPILMFLAAVSMMLGGVMAVGQSDLKRLLAYSSIGQMGYIFLGLGLGTPLGVVGALFHVFNHSIMKSLLFLDAGAVEYSTGTRDLKEIGGGLFKKMPVTGGTSLIGAMSLAGIPPFGGFWSKLIIIVAAVQAAKYWYAFWAVVASLLTLGALLRALKYVFLGPPNPKWNDVKEIPFLMRASLIVLALVCVAGGILFLPGLRESFLGPASAALLKGMAHAGIILKSLS